MLKLGKNWGKIADYPPMLNKDRHPYLHVFRNESVRNCMQQNNNLSIICRDLDGDWLLLLVLNEQKKKKNFKGFARSMLQTNIFLNDFYFECCVSLSTKLHQYKCMLWSAVCVP